MNITISHEYAANLEAIREARRQGQDVEYAAKVLADYISSGGKTGPYLNDIAKSLLANQPSAKRNETTTTKLTPDSLLTSDYLAYLLNPALKIIRKQIFGSEEVPFTNYDEAIKWIESQEASDEEFEYPEGNKPELCKVLENGNKILSQRQDVSPLSLFLPHATSGRPHSVYPRKGSDLSRVIRVANGISAQIGLTPISVVMYIIADIKPVLPAYSCGGTEALIILPTENGKIEYGRRQLDITINTELSFNELLALYNSVRRFLGVTKNKTLSSKHLELYQIVQRHGSPPKRKGTVSFWNSVKDEWNNANPSDQYGSWKAVKIAYDRIIQKLNGRFRVMTGDTSEHSNRAREVKEHEAEITKAIG
jgi:hypothetical protein